MQSISIAVGVVEGAPSSESSGEGEVQESILKANRTQAVRHRKESDCH